jgi:hypothetical protein
LPVILLRIRNFLTAPYDMLMTPTFVSKPRSSSECLQIYVFIDKYSVIIIIEFGVYIFE